MFRIGRININVSANALYVPDAGAPPPRAAEPPLPPERLNIKRTKPRKPKGRWTTSGYTTAPLGPDPDMVSSEANRLLASCEHILRNPGPRTRLAKRRGRTKDVVAEEGSVAERLRSKLTTALAGMCDAEAGRAAVEWLGLDAPGAGTGGRNGPLTDAGEALLSDMRARLQTGPRVPSARDQLEQRYSSVSYREQHGLPPRRAASHTQPGGDGGAAPLDFHARADPTAPGGLRARVAEQRQAATSDRSWATFDGFLQRSSTMRQGGRLMQWA